MAPSDSHSLEQQESRQLTLPVLVFGIVEVRRLRRELEALEDFMHSDELRQPGTQPNLPRVSRLLDALATDNHCNLLQAADRQTLATFLQDIADHAPSVHMSFASDPSSAFTAKIVTWLRTNVHPAVLLQVGLQPTLAAGCIVRTNNKQFDFSLREAFTTNKSLLLQSFEALATGAQIGVSATTASQDTSAPQAEAVTPDAAAVAQLAPATAAPATEAAV